LSGATLAQSILNGLMAGWIYVLVALGLTLVLSIMGIVNLAHGEIYMLGAYIAYYLSVNLGLGFFVALIVAIVVMGGFGIVLERFFRVFRRSEFTSIIIVAMGLMLILQTSAVVGFGSTTRVIPSLFPGVLTIGGVTLSWERLFAIAVGIVLSAAMWLMIQRTKVGQAMLAVSQNMEAASLQGIDINRVSSIAMLIGCALAAAAGALVGAIFSLNPFMGGFALMKGIAVIILGGLGSITGAVLGGLILGMIDGLVPPLLTAQLASLVSFAVVIIIMLLRPRGLMGHE
jgi:branched-chain amino acid transport system permease protein